MNLNKLIKDNKNLSSQLKRLKSKEHALEDSLEKIINSKAFRFWQFLNLIKKNVKKINFYKIGITINNSLTNIAKESKSNKEINFLSKKYEEVFSKSDFYIPYIENNPLKNNNSSKLIAFYFPQFHPFPENEKFWGKGFTEWINVAKAVPLFDNHYQPRIPDEMGFYDLRLKENLKKQIEIAKNYGIYGFCLHHYWFSGQPVMRAPFNHFLSDPSLDMPFCLHWANEPWTVRWDGLQQKGDVLLGQTHTSEDDLKFIKDIEPALKDKRYIKVNGRPLLVIYRPSLFPNIKATVERWNNYCIKKGIGKLYLVVMQTSFEGPIDPKTYGFDAAIEYPPHNLPVTNITKTKNIFYKVFKGQIFDYDEIIKTSTLREKPNYKLFRGVMPGWDVTPRRKNPDIFINNSLHKYQTWLEKQIDFTNKHYKNDERLIFINAWNEWAEGAYLEPDKKNGYSFLQATYNSLFKSKLKIAVVSHIFHDDLIDEFISYFRKIPFDFDIYASTGKKSKDKIYKRLVEEFSKENINVRVVENVGRDMAPFVLSFKDVYDKYDLVCWTHSKKSVQYSQLADEWRKYLLDNLLGSPKIISNIINQFINEKNTGLIFPDYFPPISDKVQWGSNIPNLEKLIKKINLHIDFNKKPIFPAGSMFWFRPKALRSLFNSNIELNDFESKSENKVDGTFAHALERSILYIVQKEKYYWKQCLYKPYIQKQIDKILYDEDINKIIKEQKIAVISHVYYVDLINELVNYYNNIPFNFDLYISTQNQYVKLISDVLKIKLKKGANFKVVSSPNRGFDIAPFLNIISYKELTKYDLICKIHGKKSLHNPAHNDWRKHLLDNLLGNEELIKTILYLFKKNNKLGLLYPKTYIGVLGYNQEDPYRQNWNKCVFLAKKIGVDIKRDEPLDFPSGSMFWARPQALKPLFDLKLKYNDFDEINKPDGTLAHGIERMFSLTTVKAGYDYKEINLTR